MFTLNFWHSFHAAAWFISSRSWDQDQLHKSCMEKQLINYGNWNQLYESLSEPPLLKWDDVMEYIESNECRVPHRNLIYFQVLPSTSLFLAHGSVLWIILAHNLFWNLENSVFMPVRVPANLKQNNERSCKRAPALTLHELSVCWTSEEEQAERFELKLDFKRASTTRRPN